VIVKGPLTGDGVRLSAGQRLRVRVAAGELRVEALHPLGAGESAGSHTAVALPETPASDAKGQRVAPERSSAVEPLRLSWSKRVSAGDYAAVLAEAQAGGLESSLAQRPLADLTALSDAARYLARADIARQTLLAERERFAGSPDAKGAAFLLGRISQDAGDAKSAIAWFTVYLGEAPDGSFAAEALGRKLVAVRKVQGIAQAKPLAREYLDRFPNGAHAAVAREVARAP
jgi:TolA-binding protein